MSRCKVSHEDKTERECLVSWYHNIQDWVLQGEAHHLKRFIQNRKINIDTAKNDTIREWIQEVLNIEKVTSEYKY